MDFDGRVICAAQLLSLRARLLEIGNTALLRVRACIDVYNF